MSTSIAVTDLEEYMFNIVEFVKRGRPGTREIEIVPSKWLLYERKAGKPKVLYKEPPYTDADYDLIQHLAETDADAPDEWKLYTVKIVARASKTIVVK